MRGDQFDEWECTPGGGALLEAMDAAGCAMHLPDSASASPDAAASAALEATSAPPCLDLRQLPAPEPLERALAAADALAPGAELLLLTPLLPVPLLQLLDARGFAVGTQLLADGTARVRVRAPSA